MLKITITNDRGETEHETRIDPRTATEDEIQRIADDVRFAVDAARGGPTPGAPDGRETEARFERTGR